MPDDPRPTEDDPVDGPECPDCGATTEQWENILDEETDEYTTIIDCPECVFSIETESNLRQADREDGDLATLLN